MIDFPTSPEVLHIPTGPACNNRCLFCIERSAGAQVKLSLEEIEDQLSGMLSRTDTVIFTAGEPTLNPLLPEAAARARDIGYRVIGLVTNGRRLADAELCRLLLEAGLNDVRVALVGHTAQLHDTITQRPGSFAQTVAGLKNLSGLLGRFDFHFEVNCTLVRHNYRYMRDIHDLVMSFGIARINFNVVEPLGAAADNSGSIVPRYHEVLEVADSCGLDFREPQRALSRIPVCAGGHEWVQETFMFRRGSQLLRFEPKQGKDQGPPCRECYIAGACPGVWRQYTALYGWEEFQPLREPATRQGELATIITGSPCNNRCRNCRQGPAAPQAPRPLPVARQLRQALLEGFREGVEFRGGEFLLRDDFERCILSARDMGLAQVAIESNSRVLCLRRFRERLLSVRPNRMLVKLNAPEAELHDRLARVPGAFAQTMAGIEVLRQAAIPFSIRVYRHPLNERLLERARRLSQRLGADDFQVID